MHPKWTSENYSNQYSLYCTYEHVSIISRQTWCVRILLLDFWADNYQSHWFPGHAYEVNSLHKLITILNTIVVSVKYSNISDNCQYILCMTRHTLTFIEPFWIFYTLGWKVQPDISRLCLIKCVQLQIKFVSKLYTIYCTCLYPSCNLK